MMSIRIFLVCFFVSCFVFHSSHVESWGGKIRKDREFTRLKKERRKAERRARKIARSFGAPIPEGSHGSASDDGSDNGAEASPYQDIMPPAEPDGIQEPTAPTENTDPADRADPPVQPEEAPPEQPVQPKPEAEKPAAGSTPTQAQIDATVGVFCSPLAHTDKAPGIATDLFQGCYFHKTRGNNISAGQMFADAYNSNRKIARTETDPDKKAQWTRRVELLNVFREQVFGDDIEMMITDISPRLYEQDTICTSRAEPATAALAYPGFGLKCDLHTDTAGAKSCSPDKIVLVDSKGVELKRLCPAKL